MKYKSLFLPTFLSSLIYYYKTSTNTTHHRNANMKISMLVAFTLSALSLGYTTACDCMSNPSLETALTSNSIDYVFRGYVNRLLKGDDMYEPKFYAVRVWRVFKGCTFGNGTTVIVTTGSNSALCGVSLVPKENYIFTGRAEIPDDPEVFKLLNAKNNTSFTSEVIRVNLCNYLSPYKPAPKAEKVALMNSTNVCVKCASAADCPGGLGGGFYCDRGECVNHNAPCPPVDPWLVGPPCLEDPCLYVKPCTADAKCIANPCDTCGTPLFVDSNGTRVCH